MAINLAKTLFPSQRGGGGAIDLITPLSTDKCSEQSMAPIARHVYNTDLRDS